MNNEPTNNEAHEAKVTEAEVRSEIQEDIVLRVQRRRIFPRAALVGLGAGLVAGLFRGNINRSRYAAQRPDRVVSALPCLGMDISSIVQHRGRSDIGGAGTPLRTGRKRKRHPSYQGRDAPTQDTGLAAGAAGKVRGGSIGDRRGHGAGPGRANGADGRVHRRGSVRMAESAAARAPLTDRGGRRSRTSRQHSMLRWRA